MVQDGHLLNLSTREAEAGNVTNPRTAWAVRNNQIKTKQGKKEKETLSHPCKYSISAAFSSSIGRKCNESYLEDLALLLSPYVPS